jgi:ankyrin repeat protein
LKQALLFRSQTIRVGTHAILYGTRFPIDMTLIIRTPLYLAVESGNEEVVKLLLKKGANVNVTAADGSTPLHACVKQDGKESLLECLLNAGAHVAWRDMHGNTPLQYHVFLSLSLSLSHYSSSHTCIHLCGA